MGAVLREAWQWLLLAFMLGLAIGYFARQRPTRVFATSGGNTSGGNTSGSATNASATNASATNAATKAKPIAALEVRAPVTFVVPAATPPTSAPATKPARRKSVTSRAASRRSSAKAVVLDLAAAKATIGVAVKLDDLKLIEGIGPRIETLFKADGITSWRELSKANVERLQGVLDAAGPRYKVHNPGSWPRQAGLLADGKWAEFKTLTDKLKGDR